MIRKWKRLQNERWYKPGICRTQKAGICLSNMDHVVPKTIIFRPFWVTGGGHGICTCFLGNASSRREGEGRRVSLISNTAIAEDRGNAFNPGENFVALGSAFSAAKELANRKNRKGTCQEALPSEDALTPSSGCSHLLPALKKASLVVLDQAICLMPGFNWGCKQMALWGSHSCFQVSLHGLLEMESWLKGLLSGAKKQPINIFYPFKRKLYSRRQQMQLQ